MKAEKGYLLSFAQMKKEGRDHRILFREVERWVNDPKKLFRPYTAEYIHMVFEKERSKGLEEEKSAVAESKGGEDEGDSTASVD
ncbi:hypothetical protein NM688_g8200 [Phlebia brevispora]|uniref:Uncharacterized protein n=1 Tax=Phlebia brevispora TaxID=194682 RepID=A0ACC1RW11_9APHY|nr:hypothetical protein NM688_g8200 [Phlebia brevispora]